MNISTEKCNQLGTKGLKKTIRCDSPMMKFISEHQHKQGWLLNVQVMEVSGLTTLTKDVMFHNA